MTLNLNRWTKPGTAAGAAVLFTSLLCSGMPLAQAQEHIAAVNSDRILRESVPARDAADRLKKEFSKRKADLDKTAAALQAAASKLDQNVSTMSDAERVQKQADLSRQDLDLQRKRREFDEDLNAQRNTDVAAVLEKANAAIRKIAVAGNYDLIIQEAVYVNPRIDITDKVLKALATPGAN